MVLLDVEDLITYFETRGGFVKAVDGVSLQMNEGDSLGLAGESGCGKTTTMLSIMRLLPSNGQVLGGKIIFNGVDMLNIDEDTLRKEIVQTIRAHQDVDKRVAYEMVEELFSLVGIEPKRARDYPHEFSGGMKQRAIIAMALACRPDLVIADEPVTALDVVVQAQILELMRNLRDKLGLSMILITHDLSVIADTCNKAAIMYAGKIVERGDIVTVFKHPEHPYSQGLLTNYPSIRRKRQKFAPISGRPPNLLFPPPGCRFHPRCPYAEEICKTKEPEILELDRGHYVACHMKNL